MNPLMHIPDKTPGKFRVGDRVRILHGFRGLIGEIVEDRGPIGVRGRRLYAVKMRLDEWNEQTTELPEESLEALNGEDAYGQWNLEIWDTRTGATNGAQLVKWELDLKLLPAALPPVIYLSHGIPYTNSLAANGIQYFVVNVPQWELVHSPTRLALTYRRSRTRSGSNTRPGRSSSCARVI